MAKFTYAYDLGGGERTPAVVSLPVAASQNLAVGDPVVLSSGRVAAAGDGCAALLGVMAQGSTSATVGTAVRVAVSAPGLVWRATADAAATTIVLGAGKVDLNADGTVDVADTTNGCFRVLKTGATPTEVYVTATAHGLFS